MSRLAALHTVPAVRIRGAAAVSGLDLSHEAALFEATPERDAAPPA